VRGRSASTPAPIIAYGTAGQDRIAVAATSA
jgi:hypothetical protein